VCTCVCVCACVCACVCIWVPSHKMLWMCSFGDPCVACGQCCGLESCQVLPGSRPIYQVWSEKPIPRENAVRSLVQTIFATADPRRYCSSRRGPYRGREPGLVHLSIGAPNSRSVPAGGLCCVSPSPDRYAQRPVGCASFSNVLPCTHNQIAGRLHQEMVQASGRDFELEQGGLER
jgi:hypothetical protein